MQKRGLDVDVSVIIPTYNRKEWLIHAIESVLSQTVSAKEVIVVDDGSEDGTLDMLSQYPVKVLEQSNSGPSAARNHGASVATSSWLAFLDSDDRWFPNKLEKQMSYLNDHPEFELIYTGERWIRNGKRVNACKHHQKYQGWIYPECIKLCLISPSSVLLSKRLYDEMQGFDESLWAAEDYDLWLKITSKYPVAYLEEELIIKYGGHEGQLSNQRGIDVSRVKALINRLKDETLKDDYRAITLKDLLRRCQILIKGFRKHGHEEKAQSYERLYEEYKAK